MHVTVRYRLQRNLLSKQKERHVHVSYVGLMDNMIITGELKSPGYNPVISVMIYNN